MTDQQRLVDFIDGLGPLYQEAMLYANAQGNHELRRKLQRSYVASLELIADLKDVPAHASRFSK